MHVRCWIWKFLWRSFESSSSYAQSAANWLLWGGTRGSRLRSAPWQCSLAILQPRRPEHQLYEIPGTVSNSHPSGKSPWATGHHVHFQGPHRDLNTSGFILYNSSHDFLRLESSQFLGDGGAAGTAPVEDRLFQGVRENLSNARGPTGNSKQV